MKVVFYFCLAVGAFAQIPRRCDSPKQWEGREFHSNPRDTFEVFEKISYDEENKRVRVLEMENSASGREFYDTLYLHNVGIEYKLNIRTRTCVTSPLTRPFRYRGVPPGSQFLFENTIGAAGRPDEYMVVSTFNGTFTDSGHTDQYTVTVTEPDCVPVHSFIYSPTDGPQFFDYFDITLGISDPMVFIPPSECKL